MKPKPVKFNKQIGKLKVANDFLSEKFNFYILYSNYSNDSDRTANVKSS